MSMVVARASGALIGCALLGLVGCRLASDAEDPPPRDAAPPDATLTRAPPLRVAGLTLHALRAEAGRRLPGPLLLVDLVLAAEGDHAPIALGLAQRCAVGRRVLTHDERVGLGERPPPSLRVPLFGGAFLADLPQACAIIVRSEPPPGSGARPRDLATFCSTSAGVRAGPCAAVPPRGDRPPGLGPGAITLDEVGAFRGARVDVAATLTRWDADGPLPPVSARARCGEVDKQVVVSATGGQAGVGHRLRWSFAAPAGAACELTVSGPGAPVSLCLPVAGEVTAGPCH